MQQMNMAGRLQQYTDAMENLTREMPETAELLHYIHTVEAAGRLDEKQKSLIALGISLYDRHEDCIITYTYNALKAGANRDEIMETAAIATIFGGGPSMYSASAVLQDCLYEFENQTPKPN